MSNNDDDTIDARLDRASEQLVASFSNLDTETELDAVRRGSPPAGRAPRSQRRRWLAVAAAVTLLVGGTVAIAVSAATRSGTDSTLSSESTPDNAPSVTSAPAVTDPAVTAVTQSTIAPASTAPSVPVVPVTTAPPANVLVESPSDVFVTVSGEDRAVIDVRNTDEVVASFDLSCPQNRDCVVESARVMGDTIWVAITDTEPGQVDAVVGARVVSVSQSSGDVVEHLSLSGSAAARSAGLGADGVLYAHLDGPQYDDGQLVAIERGAATVLETGVSGFRLSDDGRSLAVSFSNPAAGKPARFKFTNLVDQTTIEVQTLNVNAGPAAWSPDGQYLIVNDQWENRTAWIVDPWSGSAEPIPGSDRFLDGACFMSDRVIAHRTWNVGYGQGDAQPGVIRLTSLDAWSTVADIGNDLFGESFRCHPDGSTTYLRRPVVEVELSPDFSQLEPDYEAQLELVHISPDGTTSIIATGNLRMV